MALLGVDLVELEGIEPDFTAADADGDEFPNTGRVIFIVDNGSGSPITVSFTEQRPCNYNHDVPVEVSVPAGDKLWFGPFSPARFNDDNGRVHVGYSDVTTVTVAAVGV